MLEGEGKAKVAEAVADPGLEGEKTLFEEGWEEAIQREEEMKSGGLIEEDEEVVNGHGGESAEQVEEDEEEEAFVEAQAEGEDSEAGQNGETDHQDDDDEPSLVEKAQEKVEELTTGLKDLVVGDASHDDEASHKGVS